MDKSYKQLICIFFSVFNFHTANSQCNPPFSASIISPGIAIDPFPADNGVCFEAFNGTLNASPTGPGYSYFWTTPQGAGGSSPSIQPNYISGNYSVVVTNALGCSSTFNTHLSFWSANHSFEPLGSTTICSGQGVAIALNFWDWPSSFPFNGQVQITRDGNIVYTGPNPGVYVATVPGVYLSYAFGCSQWYLCNPSIFGVTVTSGTSPTVSIAPSGSTSLCNGASVLLSSSTTGAGTFQWKKNNVNINNATAANYQASVAGSYTCIFTNSCGSSTSNAIVVTTGIAPTVSVSTGGATILCGGSILLTATATDAGTYQWQNNSANINGATNATYQASAIGSYTCIVTNLCGSSTSNAIVVTAGNTPTVSTATGPSNFCRSTTNNIYSVTPQAGVTINWTVPTGASIVSGQGTASINVSFAANAVSGNVCVTASNACGTSAPSCKAITMCTTIPSTAGTITGSNNGCNGDSKLYTIRKVATAESYLWTPPIGATINGSSNPYSTPDTAVTVTYTGSFAGDTLRVRTVNCIGQGAERKLRINHNTSGTPATISGTNVGLCNQSNKTYSINAVTNALSYTWRTNIVGATINGGPSPVTTNTTSVIVNFGTFTSGTIYVKSNNNCGSSTERSLTLNARPSTPTSIAGPISVCDSQLGVGYSTAVIANATNYNWLVPTGATIASGQNSTGISVNFGPTPLTSNVRVRSQNSCASSSYFNLSVTVNNCPRLQTTATNDKLTIQPNPFNSSAKLILPSETNLTKSEIIIGNLLGKEVMRIKNPEDYAVQLLKSDFQTGIYIVQLFSEGNLRGSVKMVIQ